MNAEDFLANFGHIADAPGGVGRLRDLVYHFAFAGELVEHSQYDAADLAEALALTESPTGRIRRPVLAPSAGYYPIPSHWRWVNIGEIGHDWGQMKPVSDFTYIDVSAIDNHRGVVTDDAIVVSADKAPSRARKIVKKGTVIYSTVRPYLLNVAIIERDFIPAPIASTAFAILHPHEGVEAKFIYYFLRSPAFVTYVESVQSGIAYPAISDQKFFAASFPLAPTEEQKRIVAKVDELMALCEQLEAQQKEREQRFPVLSCVCHASFAEAPTRANLNRVFDETGIVSPADLRKTILTLAFQGMLVPQQSDEGTGSELLQRIKKLHPEHRTFAGGRRTGQPLLDALNGPGSFQVPSSWVWTYLNFLCAAIADVDHNMPKAVSNGVPFISAKDLKDDGSIDFSAPKMISEEDYQRLSRKVSIRINDIIYSRIGARLGKARLVKVNARFLISYSCCLIRPMHDFVDKHYLQLFLDSSLALNQARKGAQSIGVPDLGLGEIRAFQVPVPPLAEQHRIVAKVDEVMGLVNHLEAQQIAKNKLAGALAKAAVASLTGTKSEEQEKMKAPKTELISMLKIGKKTSLSANAPLAVILNKHTGVLSAKALWLQSGLTIDAFYQQLKSELAQGWIAPPEEPEIKVSEEA